MRYLRGETIVSRGVRSPGMYLITHGCVAFYHRDQPSYPIIRMGAGGMFGVTWLIDEDEHYDVTYTLLTQGRRLAGVLLLLR